MIKSKILLGVLLCAASGAVAGNLNIGRIKNPRVVYAPPEKVKVFPVPVIGYHRPGLASQAQRAEVLNRVVYPVINHSPKPIAAVIIEFQPNTSLVGVQVYWHNREFVQAMVPRDKAGKIDREAYKSLLDIGART